MDTKRLFGVCFCAIVLLASSAVGQSDPLGPHNVGGQGCYSCHTPDSGTITGQNNLWGLNFILKAYAGYNGTTVNFASPPLSTDDPKFHSMVCLSCHDGSMARSGMPGMTIEFTYDGIRANTFIARDTPGLANDHPVDIPYTPGGSHWPGIVGSDGQFIFGATIPNIDYGHPIRLFGTAANGGQAMIECSTCHNPHSMTTATVTLRNGVRVNKPTAFFVRGWYDKRSGSNSVAQFCRSCHYDKSNEYRGRAEPTM